MKNPTFPTLKDVVSKSISKFCDGTLSDDPSEWNVIHNTDLSKMINVIIDDIIEAGSVKYR